MVSTWTPYHIFVWVHMHSSFFLSDFILHIRSLLLLLQWDRVDVADPTMTVDGLCALLEREYGVELCMLSSGVTILFSDFMEMKKRKVSAL